MLYILAENIHFILQKEESEINSIRHHINIIMLAERSPTPNHIYRRLYSPFLPIHGYLPVHNEDSLHRIQQV